MTLDERLSRIETLLASLIACEPSKEWYSVEEFARMVDRSEFTCREWCRKGRIRAVKKQTRRGAYAAWAISHEELKRYQREGLLPSR